MKHATASLFLMTFALAACGGQDPLASPDAGAGGASSATGGGGELVSVAASTTASGSGGATGATSASSTTSGAGGGAEGGPGLPDVGTLVVLGDSISDGGGQGPFYYDLLLDDLEAHYQRSITFERKAQAGTTTLFLAGQIAALPAELEGPVAVVITSGGNNMQYNVAQILTGLDQNARDRMGEHIDAALTELTSPDRFGAGVQVAVYEANVYDASDGEGNFGDSGCAMPLNAPDGSAGFFADWNAVIAEQVLAHQQRLIDIHAHFAGHGFNMPPSWYAADCVHPNAVGHAAIRDLLFTAITGS